MSEFETERLLLRRFTLDDAEAYFPLVSLPEIIKFTSDASRKTIEEARQVLQDYPIRDYALHGFGRMACIEKQSGRLVGFCGLKYVDVFKEVDIGYRFLPECWGKGYATESAFAVMAHDLAAHGIKRVIGMVFPENVASAKVLVKLGLRFEAQAMIPGEAVVLDRYATPDTGESDSYQPILRTS